MANIKKVFLLKEAMRVAQEGHRTLPGYTNDPNDLKERYCVLNPEKTPDNICLLDRDFMNVLPGSKNQARGLAEYYKTRFGKYPRTDAKVILANLALPRTYMNLGSDFHLTDQEYASLRLDVEGHKVDDPEVLESAKKKVLSKDYTDAEKDAIKDFFKKAFRIMCMVYGIKEDDVLYAIVHMDETIPHIHMAFLPAVYVQDKTTWADYQERRKEGDKKHGVYGDMNREIGPDEIPVACNNQRLNRYFLKFKHHQNLEAGFKELYNMDVKLTTGKGHINDVQETDKAHRKYYAEARALEEEAKRRKADMETQISAMQAEFDEQYSRDQSILSAQKAENMELKQGIASLKGTITEHKKQLKKLRSAIKAATTELKEIRTSVSDLIQNGIRTIKRAFLNNDKKKAKDLMDEATESLLTIQSKVDSHLADFANLLDDDDAKDEEMSDLDQELASDEYLEDDYE
ncbi:MAG: plasmid recombination protein [Lachnospiraceae bacterium]|nr:plasmid recombination protein [Lachnospiraceae bacterium]